MDKELLLLFKNHRDTLIEQTKTQPQETLESKKNKQMETFSFSLTINRSERGKWLLAVTLFEATNSSFNITFEYKKFSISTPGHWNSDDGEERFSQAE